MTDKILNSKWWFRLVTLPILVALAVAGFFSEALFRAHVLDLRAVIVTNEGLEGEDLCDAPPCVTVDRVIRRSHIDLVWWVSVHDAETGGKEYITPTTPPARYDRAAYLKNPVLHRSLAWWMGGQSKVDDAALVPGREYYIRTCHAFSPLQWPRACTISNSFAIEAANADA